MNVFTDLLQLIFLRKKPQDISYQPSAAALCFVVYIATSVFQIQATGIMQQPMAFALAQGVAQALIYFWILRIAKKPARFIQMATAIFGVSAILQFLALAFMQLPALAGFGMLASVWQMVLLIYILKETMETSTGIAILITLFYHFVIGLVLIMLFPDFFNQMQDAFNATKDAANQP